MSGGRFNSDFDRTTLIAPRRFLILSTPRGLRRVDHATLRGFTASPPSARCRIKRLDHTRLHRKHDQNVRRRGDEGNRRSGRCEPGRGRQGRRCLREGADRVQACVGQ